MKKYFVVADVHGFYNEMCEALAAAGYDKNNPDYVFISLGDLLDRGPGALECLNFVNSLSDNNKILILGNHELLLQEVLMRGFAYSYDHANGTVGTIEQITGVKNHLSAAIEKMHFNSAGNQYFNALKTYEEVGDNIFIHGGIPCHSTSLQGDLIKETNGRQAPYYSGRAATGVNGMNAGSKGVREPGKTIGCGHGHTSGGHAHLHHYGVEFLKDDGYHQAGKQGEFECFDPFIDDGIIAMDACTAHSHKINCLTFEY